MLIESAWLDTQSKIRNAFGSGIVNLQVRSTELLDFDKTEVECFTFVFVFLFLAHFWFLI